MSFESLLTQTVTVVHYDNGAEDAHGNPARVEASRVAVRGRLRQAVSREETTDRDAVTDRWLLDLLPDVAIDAGDEVLYDGREFHVDGTPQVVQGRSAPHHILATLRYVGDVT